MNATGPGLGFLPDTLVLAGNDSSGVINVLCAKILFSATSSYHLVRNAYTTLRELGHMVISSP